MTKKEIRSDLIRLGPEQLADALIDLAEYNEEVRSAIKRMIATPNENVIRYKAQLAALRRSTRFVDWRGASGFARQLENMLADAGAGCDDPKTGVELAALFFEADSQIMEQCDDSSGCIGDVFRCTACDFFVRYAAEYTDKGWLVDKLIDLHKNDDYGVRDVLLDSAHRYLPPEAMRDLADRLWQRSQVPSRDKDESHHWLIGLESVARQLKDGPLFERAQRAMEADLSVSAHIDIAQVYLSAGDANTALSWLERTRGETFRSHDRDSLLLAVYTSIGERDKAAEVAWRIFRSCHDESSLKSLLSVIGEEQRDQVIQGEAVSILHSERLSSTDAEFLISVGLVDDAESYLLGHASQLDGRHYTSYLPIAESMEEGGRALASSIIYRSLLDSILARAVSKYYHHGVKYLMRLDKLSRTIADWRDFENHETYKSRLRQNHGRKTAFWSGYAGGV